MKFHRADFITLDVSYVLPALNDGKHPHSTVWGQVILHHKNHLRELARHAYIQWLEGMTALVTRMYKEGAVDLGGRVKRSSQDLGGNGHMGDETDDSWDGGAGVSHDEDKEEGKKSPKNVWENAGCVTNPLDVYRVPPIRQPWQTTA